MCLQLGGLSCGDYKKILMKTGLVLLVLGHISFITAALLHGTALRFVTDTHDAVSLQYAVSNILAVTSAILVPANQLTFLGRGECRGRDLCLMGGGHRLLAQRAKIIACGISVIVLSRYLSLTSLRWTVFAASIASALFSLVCSLGLLASIAITFANQGRSLLATCSFGNSELLYLTPDCPFDPTRIYSSTLCLWAISLALCVAESTFAVRSAQLTHQLLELRPWWGKRSHQLVTESSSLCEGRDLLSCSSVEPAPL